METKQPEKQQPKEKEYQKKYHRNYYQNNSEHLKNKKKIINFKKKYTYIPLEYMSEFKKNKVLYLKLVKNRLQKEIILSILKEFYP
jgi:hypothetical protein